MLKYEVPTIMVQARWFERITFLLSTILAGSALYNYQREVQDEEGNFHLEEWPVFTTMAGSLVCILLTSIAYRTEGLRWCQVFQSCSFVIIFLTSAFIILKRKGGRAIVISSKLVSIPSNIAVGFQVAALLLYFLFGEVGYDRIQKTILGKMGVGGQQFWTSKHSNFVVASYPISKKQFNRASRNSWMPFNFFGDRLSRQMGKLQHWLAQMDHSNSEDMHLLDHVVVPAVRNAKFDLIQPPEEMKLIPVVLSHGLAGFTSLFYSYQIELAANGYIVFALNHNDRSCSFTMDESESQFTMDKRDAFENYKKRREQLMIRQAEMDAFIEELCEPGFLQKKLRFPAGASIDIFNLIVIGHQLGGTSSISAGVHNHRVKACCAFDPWLFPVKDESSTFSIPHSTPYFSVRSRSFNKMAQFDATKTTQRFFDRHIGVNTHFNSVVSMSSYIDQTDVGFLLPVEMLLLKFIADVDVASFSLRNKAETVLSHLWLVMDFLISEGLCSSMTNVEAIQKKARELYKGRVHKEIWEGQWQWREQIEKQLD